MYLRSGLLICALSALLSFTIRTDVHGADKPNESEKTGGESAKTPPTEVEDWDLELDFAKINQQWPIIEAILRDEEYFKLREEDVSKWSCGLQAGHIVLVMKHIADGIDDNLANPTRNRDGKHAPMTKMVFTRGVIPRGLGKAPGFVMPLSGSREGWLEMLEDTRKRWEWFEADKQRLVDCEGRFSHFAFGALSSTDWTRFAAIHTAHHLKIVRDILRKAGEDAKDFGKELR